MKLAVIGALFGGEQRFVRETLAQVPCPVYIAADYPHPLACVVAKGDRMWQKERLLNLALSQVPPECDAIAWIDLDLIFTRMDWPELTVAALEKFPVVQLFTHVIFQRKAGDGWPHSTESVVRNPDKGHPGFAWAARREHLERRGGFFDEAILGGGDSLMWDAWTGSQKTPMYSLRIRAKRWSGPVKVWCVDQTIVHRWHGTWKARAYRERQEFLQSVGFDPERHLVKNDDGAWCWTPDSPVELKEYCRNYFTRRRNDAAGIGQLRDGHGAPPRTERIHPHGAGGVRSANLPPPGIGGSQPVR